MASDTADIDSRKRKRAEKGKEGSSSGRKRHRAEHAEKDDAEQTSTPKAGKNGKQDPVNGESVGDEGSKKGRTRRRKHQREKVAKQPQWRTSSPVGGRYIRHDAVFPADGKYLFAATARGVQIGSVADSLIERTIPASSESVVTAFALSGGNPSHMYICSANGSVERWNWMTKTKVDTPISGCGKAVEVAIHTDPETEEDDIYLTTVSDGIWNIRRGDEQIYTSMLPLANLCLIGECIISTAPGRLIIGHSLGDNKHRFVEYRIGVSVTSLAVQFQSSQSAQKNQKKGKKMPQDLLSIALGSNSGEIFVYDSVSTKDTPNAPTLPEPRTLHWHRDAVESVKWSRDGNYLVSGGRETVLVLWQMVTGKAQYLPHLTAEIEHITVSPNGAAYAIQMADNSVMVLSTSELKPTANFAGIQAQYPSTDSLLIQKLKSSAADDKDSSRDSEAHLRTAAAIHPIRKNEIVFTVPPSALRSKDQTRLLSRPFLQSYDIATSRHIARQALTRNKITDFNTGPEGNLIVEPDVRQMQVSHDGQWLATVEAWEPPARDAEYLASDLEINEEQRQVRREVYLKFWHWSEPKQQWALETRIDNPHPSQDESVPGRITNLASDPAYLGFSTLGEDGCVRIWTPKKGISNGQIAQDWRCQHNIPLESGLETIEQSADNRGTATSSTLSPSIAYSPDGSLLVVSLGEHPSLTISPIHFINTVTGTLSQSLSGLYTGSLISLSFLTRHLIILSTTTLTIHDIVTSTLLYRAELGKPDPTLPLPARPRFLAIDHDNANIAVALPAKTSDDAPATRLQVFGLEGSKVLYTTIAPGIVTALLAVKGRKGFTVLTSEAEIFHVLPPAGALSSQIIAAGAVGAAAGPETSLIGDAMDEDEDDEDVVDDEDAGPDAGLARLRLQEQEPEADRPVVRPEELAKVFDGPTVAALPVRAMFEAVVGLFGRKPMHAVQANA